MYGALPRAVFAYGWIPFLIVTVLCLLFSVVYVLVHRATRPRYLGTTTITILGLFFTLISSILVPLDVFLISYMKNPDGTWKDWAETEEERDSIKDSILYCYYASYSVILTFCFLIFPANFFYHGLNEEASFGRKFCRSMQFTLLSLFLFSILVIAGIFIPFSGNPPSNETSLQKFEWYFYELENNKGQDLLVFVLNVINLIGMCILICYTGFGLSSLPFGVIYSKRGVDYDRSTVSHSIEEIENQIEEIRGRDAGGYLQQFEQTQVDRLEQQVRLLRREQRDLEQRAKNAINRCRLVLMPCQMGFGIVFCGIGFLIFLSLFLENVDKAIHSAGPLSGYSLQNSSLPNPLDLLLVLSQEIFPMDYVIYTGMVLFLVLCSMSGIKAVGIRFCWVTLYKIKAWKTHPRGLMLAILSLMYIIMALNVVMFSLVPDYTMYGNQHFIHTRADNTTVVERCGSSAVQLKQDDCVPSRISVLLLAFHYKVWIFGAAYYWLNWIFLVVICVGSVYSMYRIRNPIRTDEEEEDLLSS